MYKVAVATLGCKVNQCESASLSEEAALRGMTLVPFEEAADYYIVNTCTVTGKTDYQSRQLIRRAIRRNPRAAVIVTGCYAQRAPEDIARIQGVRCIVGNTEKSHLFDLLGMASQEKQVHVGDIRSKHAFTPTVTAGLPRHTRAFLKIQDGCDASCSYCIVPRVRGMSRSLGTRELEEGVASFVQKGYREVVLTGVHLGAYGHDLLPATDLTTAVKRIIDSNTIERLRLSSIEPREVSDSLISVMVTSGTLCRHLHIPLQSGDDSVLASMNRDYDAAFFRDLLKKIHAADPDIAVGIDVIAGFPGETEDAYTNTVCLVESLPISYLHVFPYSPRPGTLATAMPSQVPEAVKKRRARLLRELGIAKRRAFAERFIGSPLNVLSQGKEEGAIGSFVGLSDNYIPVLFHGNAHSNRIVRVLATSFRNGRLLGEVVDG